LICVVINLMVLQGDRANVSVASLYSGQLERGGGFLLGMTGWSTLICRPQLKSCSQGMWWNKSKRLQTANSSQTNPWRVERFA
jgi:hypothetical protein